MAEFVFDGTGIEEVIRGLHEAADRVEAETMRTVLEIGEELAETAKGIASEHSSSIPGTIRVVPIPHGVAVRAGSASVPLAALYDLGNQGRGKRKIPTFNHPVYARGPRKQWTWASRKYGNAQKRYPFLAPARKLMRKQITARMDQTWERALEPYTRGGER